MEKDGVDDGQAMMRMDGDHVIEEVATETGEGVQQNVGSYFRFCNVGYVISLYSHRMFDLSNISFIL